MMHRLLKHITTAFCASFLLVCPAHSQEFETPLYDALLASIQSLFQSQLSEEQKQTVLLGEQALQAARLTDTLRMLTAILYPPCSEISAVELEQGTTEVVAAESGKSIQVCRVILSWKAPVDVSYLRGTGTACGTGTASLSGSLADITYITDEPDTPIQVPSSQAFCIEQNGNAAGGGYIIYGRTEQ